MDVTGESPWRAMGAGAGSYPFSPLQHSWDASPTATNTTQGESNAQLVHQQPDRPWSL
jgi:hypothetical protein